MNQTSKVTYKGYVIRQLSESSFEVLLFDEVYDSLDMAKRAIDKYRGMA